MRMASRGAVGGAGVSAASFARPSCWRPGGLASLGRAAPPAWGGGAAGSGLGVRLGGRLGRGGVAGGQPHGIWAGIWAELPVELRLKVAAHLRRLDLRVVRRLSKAS